MSALNLTNMKTGIFNDIYMMQNTGQTSIYNLFGTITSLSNFYDKSYINNKFNAQTITNDVFSNTLNIYSNRFGTIESRLSNANTSLNNLTITVNSTITSISNINNTLPSLITSSTLANYSFNSITSNSLFMNGAIRGVTQLSLISNTTNGVNLTCSGTSSILSVNNNTIVCNRNIFASNSLPGGDLNLTLRNTASGFSSINLDTNNPVLTSRIYSNQSGNLVIQPGGTFVLFNNTPSLSVYGNVAGDVVLTLRNQQANPAGLSLQSNSGASGNTFLRTDQNGYFSIFNNNNISCKSLPNGCFQVMNNNIQNKMLVMYDGDVDEAPSTAFNFSGIGLQTGNAMRYQTPTSTTNHRFFCGTTQSFFISNGSGSSGSDSRWKTEIQGITNGLDKVKQLQGKTFKYNNCIGRQMGLIAQDVKPVVPEIVVEDEVGYHYLCYDRLVALLIEAIKELEARVLVLENNI